MNTTTKSAQFTLGPWVVEKTDTFWRDVVLVASVYVAVCISML